MKQTGFSLLILVLGRADAELENSISPNKRPEEILAVKQTGFSLLILVLGRADAELEWRTLCY